MRQYLDLFTRVLATSMREAKVSDIVTDDMGGENNDSHFHRFTFNGKKVRGKLIDGEPWLVGSDVAKALEYSNPHKAVRDHVEDEDKLTERIVQSGQHRNLIFVNEGGIYSLVFQSHMEEAKAFKRWVTKEVLPSIRKTGGYGRPEQIPDCIKRMRLNYNHVPNTHFSVLNELYQRIYLQFEKVGYVLPDISEIGKTLMPDISVGKCFAKFLKDKGYDVWNDCIKYKHHFADGRVVEALAYPLDMLPVFIRYVNEVWLPERASQYLGKRAPKALEYLPKVIDNK